MSSRDKTRLERLQEEFDPAGADRQKLENVVGALLEELVDLESRLEDDGQDDVSQLPPIELNARTPRDGRMLSSNQDRGVEVWRELPRWCHYSTDGKSFVLDNGEIKQAVADLEEDKVPTKVHNATVRRVRDAIEDLSGTIASVEKKSSRTPSGRRERVLVVPVPAWARLRPREVVDRYLELEEDS